MFRTAWVATVSVIEPVRRQHHPDRREVHEYDWANLIRAALGPVGRGTAGGRAEGEKAQAEDDEDEDEKPGVDGPDELVPHDAWSGDQHPVGERRKREGEEL